MVAQHFSDVAPMLRENVALEGRLERFEAADDGRGPASGRNKQAQHRPQRDVAPVAVGEVTPYGFPPAPPFRVFPSPTPKGVPPPQERRGNDLLFLGLPPQTLLMTTNSRLTYKNRMPDWKRERASEMRATPTRTEDILWQCLRGHHSDRPRWRSQRTMFGYIVDFWCAQAKLVVEVDGGYHQTEAQRRLDAHRDAAFREHGIRTLRFTNDQVLQELPIVLAAINQATHGGVWDGSHEVP